MLLVCRFTAGPDAASGLRARARVALELLTASDGCLGGELGRSVDGPDRWVLTVRFAGVDAYRRALSTFPVREHVVPLLQEAVVDEPATFEMLLSAAGDDASEHPSLLA